jgi:hypothetical protein
MGRSLWREDGSVVWTFCWTSPAQSVSDPSPLGLVTIFYCLRFETFLFVASYDSQGHGGGILPRLHTGMRRGRPLTAFMASVINCWSVCCHDVFVFTDRYLVVTIPHCFGCLQNCWEQFSCIRGYIIRMKDIFCKANRRPGDWNPVHTLTPYRKRFHEYCIGISENIMKNMAHCQLREWETRNRPCVFVPLQHDIPNGMTGHCKELQSCPDMRSVRNLTLILYYSKWRMCHSKWLRISHMRIPADMLQGTRVFLPQWHASKLFRILTRRRCFLYGAVGRRTEFIWWCSVIKFL